MSSDRVCVGRIVRPQGNRGEVVVAPETDRPEERFAVGADVVLVQDGHQRRLTVRESRAHGARWVVGFDGVTTIDAAEALRHAELVIPLDRLPALGGGAYYMHDLIGCTVETMSGTTVGEVVRMQTEVGTPLLIVATARGERMVPFAETICRRIDVGARRIVIDPPEGLLEL
jgi:16S rRNA processing protein RimM